MTQASEIITPQNCREELAERKLNCCNANLEQVTTFRNQHAPNALPGRASQTKLFLLSRIGLNKCEIEKPRRLRPGDFSIAVLLTFYMVNGKVSSEIGEYIGDDDRS